MKSKRHFWQRIEEEILSVIPAIIFFCAAFNIIYFTSGLMLKPDDVRYFDITSVNLGALVVGKVMILVNSFAFINAFPHKPLIYNIIWKSVIYCFFVFVALVIETLFHLTFKFDNLDSAWIRLQHELFSPIALSTLIWLMVTFFIYVIASEFVHALGKPRIKEILFYKR